MMYMDAQGGADADVCVVVVTLCRIYIYIIVIIIKLPMQQSYASASLGFNDSALGGCPLGVLATDSKALGRSVPRGATLKELG